MNRVTRLSPVPTISGGPTSIASVASIPGSPDPRIIYIVNDAGAPRVFPITSSATPAIDTNSFDAINITALAVAITSMTSGLTGTPSNFQQLTIRIKDNGTGRAITWGTSFISSGVALLPTTTIAGKTHHITLLYDPAAGSGAGRWVCMASDAVGY